MFGKGKYSLEGIAASLLFLALITIVLLQVFGRVAPFPAPVWTEELARWIWVWMVFLGIGEAERQNAQLRMGLFAEWILGRHHYLLYTAADMIFLGVMFHLTWIGYKTVLRTWNNESVTLYFTDAALYAAFPVVAIFIIHRLIARIRHNLFSPQPADPSQGEPKGDPS